jgi:hypothetical protein
MLWPSATTPTALLCCMFRKPHGCESSRQASSRPLTHLEACPQADVTRRATDALLRGAACPAWRGEFRPLAGEQPLRSLFIAHAGLGRLINGKAGGGGDVELAAPGNVEFRHSVRHRNDQLRTQNDHRERDRHLRPPSDRSECRQAAASVWKLQRQSMPKSTGTRRECPMIHRPSFSSRTCPRARRANQ